MGYSFVLFLSNNEEFKDIPMNKMTLLMIMKSLESDILIEGELKEVLIDNMTNFEVIVGLKSDILRKVNIFV